MHYVEHDRWLLLGHQLQTRSSNARVKTWRRLQQIGAVPTRHSVYVLPNIEQCREDFEWIRTEIVALGGEASDVSGRVSAADGVNGESGGGMSCDGEVDDTSGGDGCGEKSFSYQKFFYK